jgi:hypothetical protein
MYDSGREKNFKTKKKKGHKNKQITNSKKLKILNT